MGWLTAAVEQAMKRQEVIVRALSGALTWLQAADILGIEPRSLRRWRARYEADQRYGLYDRRQLPSPRKVPVGELQRILRLYRDTYRGFNVRHFHHLICRDHGVTLSYSFGSLAPGSASCCTSTAAPMNGWPCARGSARPSSPSSTTPPSSCSMRSSGRRKPPPRS